MHETKRRHLFGPVPSRRLGRSLGIDLIPMKTCCLDCIFCQLGRTSNLTAMRREYVPTQDVLDELTRWIDEGGGADHLTLSGSGEPTLHTDFGKVLETIRHRSNVPAVLLTNGSLLHLPEVRDGARGANIVKVSLSCWNQESFERINRSVAGLTFDRYLEGLQAFRRDFEGKLWMEIFLLGGINDTPDSARKLAHLAEIIRPDRIQFNTVVRPPAESYAKAVPEEKIRELMTCFSMPTEIIADFAFDKAKTESHNLEDIFATLQRRPCTAEQLASVFGMHRNEVSKYLGQLLREQKIRSRQTDQGLFYFASVLHDNN